jgi:multiple sugar transport system permease protein
MAKYFKNNEKLTQHLFVLPALIFMVAFIGYPIIYNIILSLRNVSTMTFKNGSQFIGFANYIELFKDPDRVLNISIFNTFFYTIICLFFQFSIGFAFAIFFAMKFKSATFLRGLTMIAWMVPMTITAMMFKYMLSPSGGLINQILMSLHLVKAPLQWLIDGKTALWGVIIANIWVGIPFNMILLATGITTIPNSVYESASIDGANFLQKFFWITVPMIRPAIMSVLTLGFIFTFKVFDLIFIMTNGGPMNATEVLSTFAYRQSFVDFNFSKGAAVSNVLFIILLCVGFIYLRLTRKNEEVM